MMIWCVLLSHQIVYRDCICCLFVCDTFVAWYLVRNAWSCDVIISLSVSPSISPLHSNMNVSSSPISCLFLLLIYWPCFAVLSIFLRTLLVCFYLEFTFRFCHFSSLIVLNLLQHLLLLQLLNSFLVIVIIIIIIIIIIINIIIVISFMQGIYTYIPETNYVPREYSVAAILLLLFMVLYR